MSDDTEMYTPSYRVSGRHSRAHRHRTSPSLSGRPNRPRRMDPAAGYHDYLRHNIPSSHRQRSSRSIPRAPSFGRRQRGSDSGASYALSPRSAGAALSSPRPPLLAPHAAHNEKHALPPYEAAYNGFMGDEMDDELEEMMRTRRLRCILKYSAYAVVAFIVVLGCSLTGYFLSPRNPAVALHSINSLERPGRAFKLQGTMMQFHIELIYRVQNDNYFDMVIDDISTAVFWPETKYALGGGRLSGIRIPSRRIVEIAMPLTMRYDVKRGPPPILLGMVESCGLNDAGVGEMNLEAEVQADFHTKMKQSSV
ncbi:hypothetical protein H4R26_004533, partial [Coemansia thaxteri]